MDPIVSGGATPPDDTSRQIDTGLFLRQEGRLPVGGPGVPKANAAEQRMRRIRAALQSSPGSPPAPGSAGGKSWLAWLMERLRRPG